MSYYTSPLHDMLLAALDSRDWELVEKAVETTASWGTGAHPDDLTPTGELVLETLIARARLGEPHWPFSRRMKPTLMALETCGLVNVLSQDHATYRVSLTDDARRRYGVTPGH